MIFFSFRAIPVALRDLIKVILQYSSVTPTSVDLFIDNYKLLDDKCNNKVLRSLINNI